MSRAAARTGGGKNIKNIRNNIKGRRLFVEKHQANKRTWNEKRDYYDTDSI